MNQSIGMNSMVPQPHSEYSELMENPQYQKLWDVWQQITADVERVKKDAENPHFKSKHATINSVLETLEVEFKKHNVSAVQPLVYEMGKQFLVTYLVMKGVGALQIGKIVIPELGGSNTAQVVGSIITYVRRYSLLAAFSLQTEDDDGNSASSATVVASVDDALKKMRTATDLQAADLHYKAALKAASPSDRSAIIQEYTSIKNRLSS